MNRRRFLEYAGATTAVIGAVALGLNFLQRPQSNPTGNAATSSASSTSLTNSASSTSTQLASLSGRLSFDYNGNGKQEDNEPSLSGAKVQLRNSLGTVVAEAGTDSSGVFKIEDVPVGTYKLFPVADTRFRYMCRSVNEIAAVSVGYAISLSEEMTELNIGLMEGFLTLPIQKSESTMGSYVDLDPGPGIRDWEGGSETYDGHPGTDFLAREGTAVIASAPGRIFAAASGWPNNTNWINVDYFRNNGNFIIIDHGNGLYVAYHHLRSIQVDDTPWLSNGPNTSRGQVIGQVGNTGVTTVGGTERITVPHLHLQVWNGTGFMRGNVDALDPFRDIYYNTHGVSPWANSESLWTKDNDPQPSTA